MTRVRIVAAVVAMAAAAVLTGCTAARPDAVATTSAPRSVVTPRVSQPTPGVFNAALAYKSAWHITVTSTYVNGSADVCDLNLGISVEDSAALANSDTSIPVYGLVILHSGAVSYGTVWPTAEPGTGIVAGNAQLTIAYDASGLPTSAQGTADVTWHDASKTPATSHRSDALTVTYSPETYSQYCS